MYYRLQYIILHITLLVLTVIFCRLQRKTTDVKYWTLATFPIIFFSLEEGLRWGREIDWCVYYNVYEDIAKGINTGHELFFTLIWKVFAIFDAPYYIVILFSSFLFIYSLFFLLKPYNKWSAFIIPICIVYMAYSGTNLIRFYMGMSLLFISLRFCLDGKYKGSICFAILSAFTHVSLIFLMPIIFLLTKKEKMLFSPKTTIAICIFLIFFFDKSILSHFSFIFNLFQGIDRLSHYAEDGASWLIANGDHNISEKSPISNLLTSLPLFVVIYYGYIFFKDDKNFSILYNMMVIGIFLKYIGNGLELMGRFAQFFQPFISLNLGIILTVLATQKNKKIASYIALIMIVGLLLMKTYNFCMPVYKDPYMNMYVWDTQTHPSIMYRNYLSR